MKKKKPSKPPVQLYYFIRQKLNADYQVVFRGIVNGVGQSQWTFSVVLCEAKTLPAAEKFAAALKLEDRTVEVTE